MLSSHECIAWTTVHIIGCVAIVTLNIITIIVFTKNYSLRKRSTYLLVNLAVVDMLVGLVGTFTVYELGTYCKLWENSLGLLEDYFLRVLRLLYSISSLVNIALISVERLHATARPFRHRFLKRRSYLIAIVSSYLISALFSITSLVIPRIYPFEKSHNVATSLISICIVIIVFSYSLIFIKVKCGSQPRHRTAAGMEGRLTVTLLIVTVVSLMMWLPFIVQSFLWYITKIFSTYPSHLTCFIIFLVGANSLVNPLLYAIRIPEFRRTAKAMFC